MSHLLSIVTLAMIVYVCFVKKNHNNYKIIDFKNLLIYEDELLKMKEELNNIINKFKLKINIIKEIFDKMMYLLDIYYKINDNIFKNYNINKRNYHKLKNLNYLKNNSENLIKKLNNMIDKDNISEIFEFSFDNFYNDNGEKYIGKMKNGLKEGKGLLYYEKDNDKKRKKYEGEFKNDKPEGKGTMYWNDNDRYEGNFKNGLREGKGYIFLEMVIDTKVIIKTTKEREKE